MSAADKAQNVEELLSMLSMAHYAAKFQEEEYDDLDLLRSMTAAEVVLIAGAHTFIVPVRYVTFTGSPETAY